MATGTKAPSKVRHIRVPDILWDPAVAAAEDEGQNASEYIRDLIRADLKKKGKL